MTTPTAAATPPPPAGRIGPPIALPAIRRTLSDHGYTGPLEVARHAWRFDRHADGDPVAGHPVDRIAGWVVIATHLCPSGWWAHLHVVGEPDDDCERVSAAVTALLFGETAWRLDPVRSHDPTRPGPQVLHSWGPLEDLAAIARRAQLEVVRP